MRLARMITLGALMLGGLALGGCAAVGPKHPVGNAAVPQPARAVELERYLGRWYELARYEQGFQKDCDGVSADYARRPDGKISVLNACRKPDGKLKQAKGRAKIVDPQTNATSAAAHSTRNHSSSRTSHVCRAGRGAFGR